MLLSFDSDLIDEQVLSIEPLFYGEHKSRITKTNGVFYSNETAITLLENACIFHGSTMQGRIDATKRLLNFAHRTPFIVAPLSVSVYPTASSKHSTSVWIFNHPYEIEEFETGKSLITFMSGESITVEISKHRLLKQKNRLHTVVDTYRTLDRMKDYNLLLKGRAVNYVDR